LRTAFVEPANVSEGAQPLRSKEALIFSAQPLRLLLPKLTVA
jgi:hypothetical protein